MSCAPSRLKISFALSTSLLSSVWTEMSKLPLRILPSYFLASYSGIPSPTRLPVRPPAAAPPGAAGEPPASRADRCPGEGCHDRTRSDERSDARDGQRADPDQPTQSA